MTRAVSISASLESKSESTISRTEAAARPRDREARVGHRGVLEILTPTGHSYA